MSISSLQPWLQGDFDPIQIEIDTLRTKLREARRSGNNVDETLILQNLRGFEQLRATG